MLVKFLQADEGYHKFSGGKGLESNRTHSVHNWRLADVMGGSGTSASAWGGGSV